MNSIVIDLQQLASDSRNDISDLLRKALIVSTKLKLTEFRKWVEGELNGYADRKDVPAYRIAQAEIKALNPYRGWIPFMCEDPELMKAVQRTTINNPIAEIQSFAKSDSAALMCHFSPEALAYLMDGMSEFNAMQPVKFVARNHMVGIIDVVRTTVLNWALKLEEEGIVGEGIQFSKEEQAKAVATPNVYNFHISGTGNRAYAHSHDGSTNTLNITTNEAFTDLRKIIGEQVDGKQKDALIQKLDNIQKAKDKKSAYERFTEFMALASSLATVWPFIAPYIPLLSQHVDSLK